MHSGDLSYLHSPPVLETTSTPIVQLDAAAYAAHVAKMAAASLDLGALHQQLPYDINNEVSDNDELRSVCSETSSRHAGMVMDEAAVKLQERLQFMEELSSIERYTVYKGRII